MRTWIGARSGEVRKHRRQPLAVGGVHQRRRRQVAHDALRVPAPECLDGLLDQRAQIHGRHAQREPPGVDARCVEQIAHQLSDSPHLSAREAQILERDRVAHRRAPLAQLQRHRQRAQRVLDLVRGDSQHLVGLEHTAPRRVLWVVGLVATHAHARSTMVEIP
jgi:hypothetical protein